MSNPPRHDSAYYPAAVEALQGRYGVTHVLLYADDPKVGYARAHWREVFEAPAEHFEFFERGLLLFDMGPSGPAASAVTG